MVKENPLFEPKPRFKDCPRICLHSNLPSFKTESQIAEVTKDNHLPTLAKWICKICKHWHFWSGSGTNSNGQFKAGGDKIPTRIKKLINE